MVKFWHIIRTLGPEFFGSVARFVPHSAYGMKNLFSVRRWCREQKNMYMYTASVSSSRVRVNPSKTNTIHASRDVTPQGKPLLVRSFGSVWYPIWAYKVIACFGLSIGSGKYVYVDTTLFIVISYKGLNQEYNTCILKCVTYENITARFGRAIRHTRHISA